MVAGASATHLADVAIAVYTKDFVEANGRIFGRFRRGLVFTHGVWVFVFLDGCKDSPMIRATAELVGWLK
jgi:hypothetical protein